MFTLFLWLQYLPKLVFLFLLKISQWKPGGQSSSRHSFCSEQGTPCSSQTSPASPGLQQAGIDWCSIRLQLNQLILRLLGATIIESDDKPEIATCEVIDEVFAGANWVCVWDQGLDPPKDVAHKKIYRQIRQIVHILATQKAKWIVLWAFGQFRNVYIKNYITTTLSQ